MNSNGNDTIRQFDSNMILTIQNEQIRRNENHYCTTNPYIRKISILSFNMHWIRWRKWFMMTKHRCGQNTLTHWQTLLQTTRLYQTSTWASIQTASPKANTSTEQSERICRSGNLNLDWTELSKTCEWIIYFDFNYCSPWFWKRM